VDLVVVVVVAKLVEQKADRPETASVHLQLRQLAFILHYFSRKDPVSTRTRDFSSFRTIEFSLGLMSEATKSPIYNLEIFGEPDVDEEI